MLAIHVQSKGMGNDGRLERLREGDIWLGMVLPFNVYDKNHALLLSRNHVVANPDLLRRNLERGMYADRGELEAARNPTDSQLKRRTASPNFQPSSASALDLMRGVRSDLGALLLEDEEDAPRADQRVRSDLESLLLSPTERPAFRDAVMTIANEIQTVCRDDSNGAIASTILDRAARYPIRKSANTAILAELILRHVEADPARRRLALAAALTMNIAMLRLQETLYRQATPLTTEQRSALNTHATVGASQLRVRGVTDETWLCAVAQHHEQLDGKGYPRRLKGAEVTREAQAIMIAERYCSMVSERAYRRPMLPSLVLKKLFLQDKELNTSLVELLVREVGIYPPGSYVRLARGEIAIVVRRGEKAHQPIVCCIADANRHKLKERILRNTSEPTFQVATAVLPWDVTVEHDPTTLCRS